MKWWEIIIHLFGIAFCNYAYIKCYSLIFKDNINALKIKQILIFIGITLLTLLNTFYNYGFSKIIISFIELFILFKSIYNQSLKQTFLKSILLYMLGWIVELFIGVLAFYILFNNIESFDQSTIFKVLFSNLMNLIMLLFANFKFVKQLNNKLYKIASKAVNATLVIIMFIIVLVLLTYYLIITVDIFTYVSLIIIILIIASLIFISIYQIILTKKATDKQEILLDFMKEYEIIIDKERIDRHEMVNNLLVLKSIKNKNTKNYNKILNDILLTYQSSKTPSGLYELPSGLKGLFYYKIHDMKNSNIDTFINISNKIIKDLDNLDSSTLTRISKILGILLDNAKEAAKDSKEKLVIIDLYKEKNNIIIYIENSVKDSNIDINGIKAKGFSTKGNNRGYGLYIVDKLLENKDTLDLTQEIKANKFISILAIKNN